MIFSLQNSAHFEPPWPSKTTKRPLCWFPFSLSLARNYNEVWSGGYEYKVSVSDKSPHRNDLTYPVLLSFAKLSLLNAYTEFIPRDGLVWMLGLHLMGEDRVVGLPIVRVLVDRAWRCDRKLKLWLNEALPGRLGNIELWSVIPAELGHLKWRRHQ